MSNRFQKIKIVKLFASSEYSVRNKAFKAVKNLLKLEFGEGKKQLAGSDVLAIWKGLYMWLWMQDKPILHEEVVEKICSLLPHIANEELALEFIRCFFVTMNREWPKIDKHRIDKFYMLVRDMVLASFRWQAAKRWAPEAACTSFLISEAIAPTQNSGLGLKMHLADILLDELVKVDGADRAATTHLVTELLLSLVAVESQDIFVKKLQDRFISRLQPLAAAGKLQVDLRQVGEALLQKASHSEMRVRTRNRFFKIHTQFSKCATGTQLPMENEPVAATETAASDDVEMREDEAPQEVCNTETETMEDSSPSISDTAARTATATLPVATSNGVKNPSNEQERKVTFGKRYTKKFMRSSTSIPISAGTVKQREIKSILKRTSSPVKKSR